MLQRTFASPFDFDSYYYVEEMNVRFLKAHGAKVALINPEWDLEKIKNVMRQINGLFFTGGGYEPIYDPKLKEYADIVK